MINNLRYSKRRERVVVPEVEVEEVLEVESDENILAFSCSHLPWNHKNYLGFLQDTQEKYDCSKIICLGDLVDNNSISYHEKNPDGCSDGHEINLTKRELESWIEAFPVMECTSSNHGDLPLRKAMTTGFSKKRMKSDNEVYDMPDEWKWYDELIINDVIFFHGVGKSGITMNRMWMLERMSRTVTGHGHSNFGVSYQASKKQLLYGVGAGCGIDIKAYSMEYGRFFGKRPILGCAVITDNGNTPLAIPMKLGV